MKIILAIFVLSGILNAGSCTEWYKDMREKYNIVGLKAGIVMDDSGEWQKLFAVGQASVDFNDQDENMDALEEAQIKAKVNMSQFMKEEIASDKVINNISKKVKTMTLIQGGKQATSVSKRTIKIKAVSIRNSSNTLLKGVVVLCESIDPSTKIAKVIVGVSKKTIKAAESISDRMNNTTTNKGIGSGADIIIKDNTIKEQMDASTNMDF